MVPDNVGMRVWRYDQKPKPQSGTSGARVQELCGYHLEEMRQTMMLWALYMVFVTLIYMSIGDLFGALVFAIFPLFLFWPVALVLEVAVTGIKEIWK